MKCFIIPIKFPEIIDLLWSGIFLPWKIFDDCEIQNIITDCLQTLVRGDFPELFKFDFLIQESVADYRTDKPLLIPDRKSEKIFFDRITYFIPLR